MFCTEGALRVSDREATKLYIRHFLSAWSANKQLWTEDEIEKYTDAYSQPGALRGGFNCYRAALRGGAFSAGGTALVETPTRVLWGDGDSIIPFAWSDKLGDFFATFELKKMEGVIDLHVRQVPSLTSVARYLDRSAARHGIPNRVRR